MKEYAWYGSNNYLHCPCKDCPDREVGCHGKCKRYAEWRKVLEEKRHADRIITDSTRTISADAARWIMREKKRKNRRHIRETKG